MFSFFQRSTLLAIGFIVGVCIALPNSIDGDYFFSRGDKIIYSQNATCLAKVIYFEARNQPLNGQIAVASVVLNRVSAGFSDGTICGVVKQGCSFQWVCTHNTQYNPADVRNIVEKRAWDNSLLLANAVIVEYYRPRNFVDPSRNFVDPSKGAIYFHAFWCHPYWEHNKHFRLTADIHKVLFYKIVEK